jgi:cytochrome c oxidase subunit I+III
MYNENLAKFTFFFSFLGFNILYFPYFLLLDMPRRISSYPADPQWFGLNFTATLGAFVFGPALIFTVINLILSYRKNVPSGPNPWESKEMEWTGKYQETSSDYRQASVSESAGIEKGSLKMVPGQNPTKEEM